MTARMLPSRGARAGHVHADISGMLVLSEWQAQACTLLYTHSQTYLFIQYQELNPGLSHAATSSTPEYIYIWGGGGFFFRQGLASWA